MQLIFFNGPTHGAWNATILSAAGHVQVNKIPGSQNQALDEAVRRFADEQDALPPARENVIAFIENYGHFVREETESDLVLFNWSDEPVAEAVAAPAEEVTGETSGSEDISPEVAEPVIEVIETNDEPVAEAVAAPKKPKTKSTAKEGNK